MTDYWNDDPAVSCPATVRILDDRFGVFTDGCDLCEGHDGDHKARRTACEPEAYLGWAQEVER